MKNQPSKKPAIEVVASPSEPGGRTVARDWHQPVYVESALHNALAHMIDGLQAAWSDGGTTVGYFHDVQFKAHAIEDLLAVLLAEMAVRGARETEDV